MKIYEVAHHRNGTSGESFYAIRFANSNMHMLAIVFPEPGHIAVFDLDLLPTIEFGVNSWRGDEFEPAMRQAIDDYENERAEIAHHALTGD